VVTQVARPDAVWTKAADAPQGALSHALEGKRHDLFIDLAQKGDIDIVFFGSTNTEMWWWPDRGRGVWDRAFASLKAANFGSQGTQQNSLLWRMRNGELDGYQAKLVVLQEWGVGNGPNLDDGRAAVVAYYSPLIAEIRLRQPHAKILLVADLPRGQVALEPWRQVAKATAAAFGALVDNETVFYIDFGERFFLADGSHNQQMWRYPPVSGMTNVGIQVSGFEAWAEALQPWLDRFVR
jgi:hypothetical protein